MKDRRDEGSWAWKQAGNNRRLIDLQEGGPGDPAADGEVELAFFGGSDRKSVV